MAEGQFLIKRVTSNVDKYCHLLMALPDASHHLVSHLVEEVPADSSYQMLKDGLLTPYQQVKLLSKVELLGTRKPTDLLAAMAELCLLDHLDSPFFFYFFYTKRPREIRMLLSEEHRWASASRKLTPALAFRHPSSQSATGPKNAGLHQFNPVPDLFRHR
jgi:hypothetical protein